MNWGFWGWAVFLFWLSPGWALVLARSFRSRLFLDCWTWSAACALLGGSLAASHFGGWGAPAGSAASLIIALTVRWYRRKKRRSAAALIGEKSKALRAALVRRARQSARPSPVLRPSLRGA